MRLVVDTIEFGSREMPKWNTISISGYHIREAGSTAVQELAFTLSDGFEYVRWCLDRGLDIDEFAPRLSFFFNSHNDLFEEVAKFRAARRIWAHEMRETFGAKNERSWWMRFHTQTAGVSLMAQQPEVNLIRTAVPSSAQPSKRSPPSWAGRRASTRIRWTKPSRYRARRPLVSRCARSR